MNNEEQHEQIIYLTIHSAKDLPKSDVVGKGDPYVIIKYGHTQYRSVTVKNTFNPEWNFEVDFKVIYTKCSNH